MSCQFIFPDIMTDQSICTLRRPTAAVSMPGRRRDRYPPSDSRGRPGPRWRGAPQSYVECIPGRSVLEIDRPCDV